MLEFIKGINKKTRLIFIDIILLNITLAGSFFMRFDLLWFSHLDFWYFVILSGISFLVLYFSNLYNKMWRYASIEELFSIIKVSTAINLLLVFYIFIANNTFPRSVLLINFMADIFILGISRFAMRIFVDYISNNGVSSMGTRVLIIGAGDAGEIIIREMNKHPELKKRIVGLIDDDSQKKNLEIHGVKVLGDRYDIPKIVDRHRIDELIIAMPSAGGKEIKEIYNLANTGTAKVKIVPGMFEIINGDVSLSQIRDVKVEDLLGREQVYLNNEEIAYHIENSTLLVTGAGGSIGSELCRQLSRFHPQRLILLDNYENNLYFLDLELREKFKNIEFISVIASIRDKDRLGCIFKEYQPDLVFHAAAHKHVPLMEDNPEEAVKNNIIGTRNLLEVAEEYRVKRFVLISTDKAVNPTNVMGASKRVAEMLIQIMNKKSKTKFMAVRFGNVLGSNGSVIPIFKKQISEGGPVTVTHEEVTRYFMTIPEAVQLVIQAGTLGEGGEVFVLDMGEPVKIIDLARDLIKLSGFKPGEDIEIDITGLRPGEKLYEELLNDNENNIATEHERIFINRLEEIDEFSLRKGIGNLEKAANNSNSSDIINMLIELVDTYQPKRDNITGVSFINEINKEEKTEYVEKVITGEIASSGERDFS